MPGEMTPPNLLIKTPSFNWESVNLHDQWKLFSEQCKYLLTNDGPFSKHGEAAHVTAILNWLGPKSYQVFDNLNFEAERKEKHFKPTQSVLQSQYQLGSIYLSQCKDQTEFMSKLCDVANDCRFANKDEIVKILFLIHNTNERVKDQLIEKIKTVVTLTDILQLAKTVELTVQMETLSKQLLQNIGKLGMTIEVHAIKKHHHIKSRCFKLNPRNISVGKSCNWDKGGKNVVIVVIPMLQNNALPMAWNISNARRRIINSQVVGVTTLNVFQGKMSMKWRTQSLNIKLILWNLN